MQKRKRPFLRGVMSSLHKWMGVVWVQEKEMKLRNHNIWKLYPSASGNDYTSSMGGTKESSSSDTCKRQNFVCHEYFVPKLHLPGKKTHLWSFPEINNNKRTHSWDPEKMHLWSCPKKTIEILSFTTKHKSESYWSSVNLWRENLKRKKGPPALS